MGSVYRKRCDHADKSIIVFVIVWIFIVKWNIGILILYISLCDFSECEANPESSPSSVCWSNQDLKSESLRAVPWQIQ